MPLVSIIVPVYNAEKTLERCINSILNQEYRDFELILLDDGSTDTSGAICDACAERDDRIRVLHKENTGVSDTRNRGIAMAKGAYLQFADADDWITPEATRFFVQAAADNGCDLVIADFYRVIGERVSQKGSIEEEGILQRTDFAVKMMQKPADFYYGVLWNKLYKRSIIKKHRLRMDNAVSWCEDFMFNLEYVRHARTIYAMKIPVYYYVKTKGSLVSQGLSMKKTIQMKRTVFACYNDFYKDVFDDTDYEKRKGQVYRFLFDAASDGSVSPLNIPGTYRLGHERTRVSEGVQEPHENCTYKEMAEILNTSKRVLSSSIQRLLAKEMISVSEKDHSKAKGGPKEKPKEDKPKTNEKEYAVTQEAENVMSELLFMLCDLEQIQYENFSQEERVLFEKLNEKRRHNIQAALRG